MKLDNSQMKLWHQCPLAWWERYNHNLEPRRDHPSLDFGTRIHQLLEVRHKTMAGKECPQFQPLLDAGLEAEAQLTFAAYEAYYPEEPFEVVDVERYFEIPLPQYFDLPGPHTYCGEMDGVIRMNSSGRLHLLETKTEQRNSKANTDMAWAHKSQVALYLHAAEQLYNEEFEGILLNVISRQSPAGKIGPSFRRHSLQRTRAQKLDAIANLTYVADEITRCRESEFFPSNRNACVNEMTGWSCDFLPLHSLEGRPTQQVIDLKFKPAEEYLSGL